jgi:uncharacterized membrane protein
MAISTNQLVTLTFVAALGTGLMAGLFCVFSNFMMKALGNLPPDKGIAAMQSINIAIVNPAFLLVFLGTGIVCLMVLLFTLGKWQAPGALYAIVGSLCYLIGAIVVTIVFNLPRNNLLAGLDPANADSIQVWHEYLIGWTNWNHVRSISTLAATTAFTIALRQQ